MGFWSSGRHDIVFCSHDILDKTIRYNIITTKLDKKGVEV